MTTAEAPAPVPDHVDDRICRSLEDQIRRTVEDLHGRAQQAAANLADIETRIALIENEIERHRQRH